MKRNKEKYQPQFNYDEFENISSNSTTKDKKVKCKKCGYKYFGTECPNCTMAKVFKNSNQVNNAVQNNQNRISGFLFGVIVTCCIIFILAGIAICDIGDFITGFLIIVFSIIIVIYAYEKYKVKNKPQEENYSKTVINPTEYTNTHNDFMLKDDFVLNEDVIKNKKVEFSEKVNSIPKVKIDISVKKAKRRPHSDIPEIRITNITRSTNIEKIFPLIVLDVETTGFRTSGNDIIEVSAIKYDVGFKPISCFTTFTKPRNPIPTESTKVNHITDDMVENSPPFSIVAEAFSEYISGCNFAGHNIKFDFEFLWVCGVEFSNKIRFFDTLDIAQKILIKHGSQSYDHRLGKYVKNEEYDVYDYKLETLCDYYGIYRNDTHRSLSDCYATGLLLKHLLEDKIGYYSDFIKVKTSDYHPQTERDADETEDNAIKIIRSFFQENTPIEIEHRSKSYTSLINDQKNDFCRLKITDKTKWITLDMWGVSEQIQSDIRLQDVKNKNQRHWKIPLSNINDLNQISDIIIASYNKRFNI